MNHWCAGACAAIACLLATTSRAEDPQPITSQITVPKSGKELPPPAGPDAATVAEHYFALGPWRIGMAREEALEKFGSAEPLDSRNSYRAIAHSHFAGDLPAELTFSSDKLQTVKLQIYDGNDLEQAVQHIQQALLYMNDHFGGANFEGGLKAHQDPEGKLLLQVLRHSLDSIEGGLRETDEKEAKKGKRKSTPPTYTAFEMVMNFWTELDAENNFLLGEFRFRSEEQRIVVSLYDDRAFVESRVPKASVTLFRAFGERPATSGTSAPPK
jgi:hypothetical protein